MLTGGLTGLPSWNELFHHPTGSALSVMSSLMTCADVDILINFSSTIAAMLDIGALLGSLLVSVVGERLGRKNALRVGTVWMLAGAVLQIFSYGRSQIIVGRLVSGVGLGAFATTCDAPPPQRRKQVHAFLSCFGG